MISGKRPKKSEVSSSDRKTKRPRNPDAKTKLFATLTTFYQGQGAENTHIKLPFILILQGRIEGLSNPLIDVLSYSQK